METIDLDGDWTLGWSDGQRSMAYLELCRAGDEAPLTARVPGEVHLDLERAGLLGKPERGLHALAARWVEEYRWHYRRTVEVSTAQAGAERSWIVFDRLDLNSAVFLNGEQVGSHANAFRPCRIDVSGRLVAGPNIVTVTVESGLWAAADRPALPYAYLPGTDSHLHKRHWLRKPQYQFGWDWTTRLVNVGITGSARIEVDHDEARLDDVAVFTTVAPSLDTGTVTARAFIEGPRDRVVQGELRLRVDGAAPATNEVHVVVAPGVDAYEVSCHVDQPALWWPRGHGEQNIHDVTVELVVDGRVVGAHCRSVGFRRFEVVQDPHPDGGRFFRFEVNGRPVFAKGANWVPPDLIAARVDAARYETLIERAIEANFNFLRVWGGGDYESDVFYELCDRHGILVWQDMPFACSWYPGDDEDFVEEVKLEATTHVRRLSSHPSLVMWCGNNEVDWVTWELTKGTLADAPDHRLYHDVLAEIVATEDPTRFYIPSSPFSPDGRHPQDPASGDQHPWSVGFANPDFRAYREMYCRFADEGGVLGPPSLPTLLDGLPEGQRHVGSFAWRAHDNSIGSSTQPAYADEVLRFWTGLEPADLPLDEYVYRAGLVQGEGLREYCENFRRRMFDSGAAAFWMFNDAWPTSRSWAIVDHRLNRAPSFHHVRRAMAPVHLVLVEDGAEIVVFGVNDTRDEVAGELRFGVFQLDGRYLIDQCVEATLPPNASTPVAAFPRSACADPTTSVPFAMLTKDGQLAARNRLILPRYRELRWPPPRVRVTVDKGVARFDSETFVWGVCLDLDGSAALADNFFDVYPGIPYELPWPEGEPTVVFTGNLRT